MGTVYVAHDPVLGRMVAIKVFLADLELPDASDRFAREARAAAALSHPNIVTIHDFGDVDERPYIVMEYVPGETMAEVIRRKAPVSLAEKLRWIEELCAGAAYAHQIGVIHRDIKPTNLMIDRGARLKILDFGIARMLGGTPASNATALIGTPGYMAPEQILGGAVDHRADVFAIGVVCYELLSYTEAFPGDTVPAITHRIVSGAVRPLEEVLPEAPPDLAAAVERALEKNPAERFASADAFRIALGRVRRDIESDPAAGAAAVPGGTSQQPATTVRPGTGSARQRLSGSVSVAQLTPPPDPRRPDRETLARRRAAQIEASLQQARALLQQEDLDAAMEACIQALTIDDTHAEALDVESSIKSALARRQAMALLEEAREELDRGALTGAQGLLQQARELDPDAIEARRLERDLRLARAEQERLRQRAAAFNGAMASARRALASGEIEAALAFTREACELDPSSEDSRQLEAEVLRRLDEETGSSSVPAEAEPTLLRPPPISAPDPSPTLIAPSARRTPRPATPVPPAPAAPAPATPAQGTSAPPPAPAPPPAARATRASLPAPSLEWFKRLPGVDGFSPNLSDAIATLRSRAAELPRLPRQQMLIAASVAGVVLIALIVAAVMTLTPGAPAATGGLVLEAVPWATVVEIRDADGTEQPLPTPAATPLFLNLPPGTYQVRLTGPSGGEPRTISVEVSEGQIAAPRAEVFQVVTPEDYFTPYLTTTPVVPEAGGPEPSGDAGAPEPPPAAPFGADTALPGREGAL